MTTNNYLIITIGTRDVALKNKIPQNLIQSIQTYYQHPYLYLSSPRTDGFKILKNINNFLRYIQLPILQPVLKNYFLKTLNIQPKTLNYLIIATDQPSSPNTEKHFQKDTIHFAEIIKHYLIHKLSVPAENISIHTITTENLFRYDEMYDYFNNTHFFDPEPPFKIFLLPQGGIDAINTTLMLYLNQTYTNLSQLYVNENQEIFELAFPKKFKFAIIEELLNNYDYEALSNYKLFNDNTIKLIQYIIKSLNRTHPSREPFFPDFINNLNQDQWFAIKTYIHLTKKEYNYIIITFVSYAEYKIKELFKKYIPAIADSNYVNKIYKNLYLENIDPKKQVEIEKNIKNIIYNSKDFLNIHEKIKILEIIANAEILTDIEKNALNLIKQIVYNVENISLKSDKSFNDISNKECNDTTLHKLRNDIVHEFDQINFDNYEISLIQKAYHSLIQFTNIDPPNILKEINYSIKQLQLENQNNENN